MLKIDRLNALLSSIKDLVFELFDNEIAKIECSIETEKKLLIVIP